MINNDDLNELLWLATNPNTLETMTPDETLELAKQVAAMPPENLDVKGIEAWAKRLAADISKGRD